MHLEAKRLILTYQQAKTLADTIETPKNKGYNQMGQPINEGISADTARKIQKRRDLLNKVIRPYLDGIDAITDYWEAKLDQVNTNPDELTQSELEKAQAKQQWIFSQQNKQLNDLLVDKGREEISILLTDEDLDFIIGRFDNRDDLTVRGDMLDIVVAISDALAIARKAEAVKLQEVPELISSQDGRLTTIHPARS